MSWISQVVFNIRLVVLLLYILGKRALAIFKKLSFVYDALSTWYVLMIYFLFSSLHLFYLEADFTSYGLFSHLHLFHRVGLHIPPLYLDPTLLLGPCRTANCLDITKAEIFLSVIQPHNTALPGVRILRGYCLFVVGGIATQ